MSWGTCFSLPLPLSPPPPPPKNTWSCSGGTEDSKNKSRNSSGFSLPDNLSVASTDVTVESVELHSEPEAQDGDLGSDSAIINMECLGSGIFSPSYGRKVISRSTLIGKESLRVIRAREKGIDLFSLTSGKSSSTSSSTITAGMIDGVLFESAAVTHNCTLSMNASGATMFSSFLMPPAANPTSTTTSTSFFSSTPATAENAATTTAGSSSSSSSNWKTVQGEQVTLSLMTIVVIGTPQAQV